ncbi:uncharacterized protein LOC116433400 isoform X1 [Nomia melanderi]|uniref:uncharacterized protein LOC116433400 isoform X1 n=1 Tax=Nomia melanderi TaxID=2448451 RepID=UPI003FCCD8AA
MLKSQVVNLTWSFHTSGNGNSNNLWPELCQTNQVRHSGRKKELTDTEESNNVQSLDSSEYPELNSTVVKSKNAVAVNRYCLQNPTITVIVPELSIEPKRSRNIRRFRRPDKIYVNLQEALESTRCANKMNNKELPKFRINIYKGNPGTTNVINRNPSLTLRSVKAPIAKQKKPTKLRRISLCNRNMKVQINLQKREAFERAKMEAICKDVDDIDFNTLKITADPEIDADYVKSMCAMTLYSKDYRLRNEENVIENSVYYRPDVIQKINDLHIQNRPTINTLTNSCRRNPFQIGNDEIENDIVNHTLSLQIKDDIKQEIKQEIKEEPEDSFELNFNNFLVYSRNFREYCTNMLTPGLANTLEIFLREIQRLQHRYHEKYPNKSLYKRRYYSGLKETRKQGEYKKLKFIIIAPDIEKVELKDGLDDQVSKLLDTCRKQNVVTCFSLNRRKLGYYTHGKRLSCCVGIANYSGAEELFKNVLIELALARNAFKKLSGVTDGIIDISKSISDDLLLSENIGALLKILSLENIHC